MSDADHLPDPDAAERRQNWLLLVDPLTYEGRLKWAKQARAYAAMDDPPREWPHDSEPARSWRGETVSRPNYAFLAFAGILRGLTAICRGLVQSLPTALTVVMILVVIWLLFM